MDFSACALDADIDPRYEASFVSVSIDVEITMRERVLDVTPDEDKTPSASID